VAPPEKREPHGSCPFDDRDVERFDKGVALAYSVFYVILALVVVFSAVIWWKKWDADVVPLDSRAMIGMNDFIIMVSVAIDFFQYCAMGQAFGNLSWFVQDI
jgi:hypothetical protein